MYSSSVIISVPLRLVVLGRRQAGGAMTAQSGFPCAGGAPEARSTANFDDHLSRSSVIADKPGLLAALGSEFGLPRRPNPGVLGSHSRILVKSWTPTATFVP